jgi:UDP-N-acetylmuramyl pentapeptide phosphotransferase/UDP-N-acetylglucosamine-1-phosphate transferase
MIAGWVLACTVSYFTSVWVIRSKNAGWLDMPGDRSLHQCPVPRLGGLGIWSGVLCGSLASLQLLGNILDVYCVSGMLSLWAIALVDDRKSVSPLIRLVVQLLAAILVVYGSGLYFFNSYVGWIWPVIGVLVTVWGVNLYNFMDGIDGLAGSMAVIGFSSLAVLGWMHGDTSFMDLCCLLAAANSGFLLLNWAPARIFMGDSGSTVAGFAMVVVSVMGWKRDLYTIWVPLLIFSPFWLDASITLVKRLFRGEKVWQAHREHLYQRWVLSGRSHAVVTGMYCLVMVVCAASVITWQVLGAGYNECVILAAWGVMFSVLWLWSERVLERHVH